MEYTEFTAALVLRFKDKFYLSQRIQTPNFHGRWQFPGGKLGVTENPIDGVVRETKEETGLTINEKRLRYAGQITGDPTTKSCFVYYVDLNDDEIPVRTENKSSDWKLFSYDEVLKLDLMPGLENVIRNIKNS